MNLIKLKIPATFIRSRASLSWREVRFGLVNRLLDPAVAVDLAVEQVLQLEHPSSALLELAGANWGEPPTESVEQLADAESPRPESELRDKWLYLVLSWIYEHRGSFSDPLQTVEEVYADFGYPEQSSGFVRYMPMDGLDLGSREANEQRLMQRWKQYLDETAPRYAERA
jgi:hypothetical protein